MAERPNISRHVYRLQQFANLLTSILPIYAVIFLHYVLPTKAKVQLLTYDECQICIYIKRKRLF